jgi:hypothetical protein
MLEAAGLIHHYRPVRLLRYLLPMLIINSDSHCRSLKWQDNYTQQPLRGFKLKVRWDYPWFDWIAAAALLFCLCVGGVSTGASKNWQTGLAAAGLVATLEGLVVGFLTVYDKFSNLLTVARIIVKA